MKLSRRKWLIRAAFYGTPVACFGYGSLIEKTWIDVNEVEIPLANRHHHLHGLRIALMSDFHHDEYGDKGHIRNAVKLINEAKVDAVMLAGDYISDDISAVEPLCEELFHLRSRLGTFAIYGNHDRWHYDAAVPRTFQYAGIRMLENEAVDFGEFAIAGSDTCWLGAPNLTKIKEQAGKDKPILLGWHEPDTFDRYHDPEFVVQMSGHTHGGQVCAPFYGPILLPKYGRKYPYGRYSNGSRNLFVTRGIGSMGVPTRFLCRPEIAILKLTDPTLSLPS